jgi:hypothetical protein
MITHLSSSTEVPSLMSSQNWFPLVIYQYSTLRCTRLLTHFIQIYGTGQGIINDSRVLKLIMIHWSQIVMQDMPITIQFFVKFSEFWVKNCISSLLYFYLNVLIILLIVVCDYAISLGMNVHSHLSNMTSAVVIDGISQQNSFNLIYDNPEVLIVQHLRCIVPRPEVLLFTRKSFVSEAPRVYVHQS